MCHYDPRLQVICLSHEMTHLTYVSIALSVKMTHQPMCHYDHQPMCRYDYQPMSHYDPSLQVIRLSHETTHHTYVSIALSVKMTHQPTLI